MEGHRIVNLPSISWEDPLYIGSSVHQIIFILIFISLYIKKKDEKVINYRFKSAKFMKLKTIKSLLLAYMWIGGTCSRQILDHPILQI